MLRTSAKILLAMLGVFMLYLGWRTLVSGAMEEIVSPIPGSDSTISEPTPLPPTQTRTPTPTPTPSGLSLAVQKSLAGTSGRYAIVIKNLKTGESYAQNEDEVFETASLYKLWVMSVVYDFLDKGKLTKGKPLSVSVQTLNGAFGIDPVDAERTEGFVNFTVGEALEQMITISHNYAAILLSYTVKNSSVADFLHREALDRSKTGQPPLSTASDMALFYEKLYKGKVVNTTLDREMMDLLARQQLNDRIPKYLPEGVKVAHKTGELGGYKHDAGIVFANGDYIFVVLSKSADPAAAAEREAKLSKAVYDYFSSQ